MGDVVDQPALVEGHQDRVGQRSAFDPDAQSGEVADTVDAPIARRLGCLRTEHDGQRRIDVGVAWREHAERDAPRAIGAGGAFETGQPRGLDAGYDQRIPGQGVAADERAATVREQGIGFERRARILVELAFKPLDQKRPVRAGRLSPGPAPRRNRCPACLCDAPRAAAGLRRDRLSAAHRLRAPPAMAAIARRTTAADIASRRTTNRAFMGSSGWRRRPRDRRSHRRSEGRPRAASCCSCRASRWW